MPDNNQRLVPGKGYYPGAECIVAIPPTVHNYDRVGHNNGSIVVLEHTAEDMWSSRCVDCGTPIVLHKMSGYIYWSARKKDGSCVSVRTTAHPFLDLPVEHHFPTFAFLQQHLIPIGGDELLADDKVFNQLERKQALDNFMESVTSK